MSHKLTSSLVASGLFLFLSALTIIVIGQFTDLDLLLADYYWNAQSRSFPWLHHWFTQGVVHGWLKQLFVAGGAMIVIVTLVDCIKQLPWIEPDYRRGLRLASLAAVIISASVSLLKKLSFSHCPWDVDRFLGYAPYVRILDHIPSGISPGNCMPAGHATSTLWVAALCLVCWPKHSKRGWAILGFGLLLGLLFGWSQQMRGAHFFTHTLWSLWITCAVIASIHWTFRRAVKVSP